MIKEYDFGNAKRGAVIPSPPGKTRITIRIATDLLNWFGERVDNAGGGNYQTLINDALREHVSSGDGVIENTLRRVIHEELQVLNK
jgi:uncharacterized protein (DUF4415 family)